MVSAVSCVRGGGEVRSGIDRSSKAGHDAQPEEEGADVVEVVELD